MSARIPAAVLGASGYVGGEFLRILASHPSFDCMAAVSASRAGRPVASTFGHLGKAYESQDFVAPDGWLDRIDRGSQLAVFSAAPHGASAGMLAGVLERADARSLDLHIVDASADFRYPNAADWEAVYGGSHGAPELCAQFASGLPEQTTGIPAAHIGHPGCFATAMLLGTVPLLAAGLTDGTLYVSAITGSTGSGREPVAGTHHPERHSNLYAYKALAHRHRPEVEALAETATGSRPSIRFVPHSGPFARGIHATIQTTARDLVDVDRVVGAFGDYYRDAAFVDVVEGMPRLKDVVASNRARIGVATDGVSIAVFCVIDNLVKGAAGGSVQWMNRLFELPEVTGLKMPAPAWT